jgi:hypothetical protein
MQKIGLQVARSLIPPVYYRLSAVTEGSLSYRYYGVRHPGAIFSIHFSDVLTAFNLLAGAVNSLQGLGNPCSDEGVERLRSLTQDFLFQLSNYFECGYEIFLCFCDQLEKPHPGQPLHEWFQVKGYKDEVGSYFSQTKTDLEKYRNFFNALKHSSNCTRIFQFLNPQKPAKALGFYLEGVDEKGVIGPVSSFHPPYQGEYTAWSYNLHLRNFYFLIYKIAAEMETVIQRLCLRGGTSLSPPNTPLVPTAIETIAATAFANSVSRFETAFITFYPQEAEENVKTVSIDPSEGLMAFSEYVAGNKAISPGQGWEAIWASKGDGFSRSWNLLYFTRAG